MSTKSHYEKYDKILKEHPEVLDMWIGDGESYFGIHKKYWETLYKTDEHLNNYPLGLFDQKYIRGIGLTLAESVCLHKHMIINYIIKAK
jgi:hypothetical protein